MTLTKSVLGSVAAASLTVIAAFASVPAQTNSCSYNVNTNLRLGSVSSEVMDLQKILNMDVSTQVSSSGAGSKGYETSRFGPATKRAVKAFQRANNITPASGNVGPLTRGVLNTICGGTTNTNTTPVSTNTNGTGVIANNIPVSVLVQGQAGAKLGEFVVSGNGMVSNLTFMRTGLSNNATLVNVYLYDGSTRITDGASVRTDGSISFNSASGLFTVNGTKTITVKADIATTNSSGQTVGVALTGVTMAGATAATPVTGVQGPLFSISSAQTATANFQVAQGTTVNPISSTINPGSINQTLWSDNLSIGINRVNFRGMTFKMIGSAPAGTLSNVQLYVDGVSKGTASANSNMQYVFDMSINPLNLQTGSHLVELRGDILAGASRNFYMSVERGTDVVIEDATLPGVNVAVSTGLITNGSFTIKNGGTITIGAIGTLGQSVTISQNPAFSNTSSLVPGATQVTIGSWKVTAFSEDVKFLSLPVMVVGTSMIPALNTTLANVGLYVNGAQVGSNLTSPYTLGASVAVNGLGSNLYIPAGQSVIVEVKADIRDVTNSAAFTAGQLVATLGAGSVQGISSSQTNTTTSATGQTLTISNTVAFGATSGYSGSTKAPNQANVRIGSFTIQAGSAEGITVSSVSVNLDNVFSGQLTNLTLKDGSTVLGTPLGNAQLAGNNFNMNLTIPQSTTKVIDIYADLGTIASGTVTPSMALTYRGNTSNITGYCGTGSTCSSSVLAVLTQGAATTVGAPTITAAGATFNSGLSPVGQLVVGKQTGFNIGTFNFKTAGAGVGIGGAIVKDVVFTSTTSAISSITMNGVTGTFIGGTATLYNVGAVVPADASGINLPVTVSVVCVGTTNGCVSNSPLQANVTLSSFTFNNGTTVSSPVAVSANNVTNFMTVVASKPTLTVNSNQQTGLVLGQENKIGEVTVSADAAGQITLNTITFNLSASGFTATYTGTQGGNMRIADGNTTVSNTTCTNAGICTMNGFTIAAGTSKTFSLYAIVAGTPGTSVINSVSSSVTSAGFSWTDTIGGNAAINGASIYNFPTNSYSIRQ